MAPSATCKCTNSIGALLCEQRYSGLYCDTIMKVNGKLLYAHSCVLAVASPFFRRFFGESELRHFSQAFPQIVEIQAFQDESCNFYEEAVVAALDYMYTGKCVVNENCSKEMREIARILELGLEELLEAKTDRANTTNLHLGTRKSNGAVTSKKRHRSTFGSRRIDQFSSTVGAFQANNDLVIDAAPGSSASPICLLSLETTCDTLSQNFSQCADSNVINAAECSAARNVECTFYGSQSLMVKNSNENAKPDFQENATAAQVFDFVDKKSINSTDTNIKDLSNLELKIDLLQEFHHNNACNVSATAGSICKNVILSATIDSKNTSPIAEAYLETNLVNVQLNMRNDELNERKFSEKHNAKGSKLTSGQSGNKYQCDSCCFGTNSARLMSRHCKLHKIEQKVCFYCDAHFSSIDSLNDHMLSHKNPAPFLCSHCNACFKSRTYLDLHLAKHSFNRPFICDICSMAFKWKHALKSHLVVHSNHKEYLCDNCGYATAHRSQLKAHCLMHTGDMYKCNYPGCMFESTKKQNMKYHQLTHTHIKVHQCHVCGQSFSLLKNLRRHSLLHSSVRPHRCDQCTFNTTRYDKLREHQLHHHAVGLPPERRKRLATADLPKSVSIVKSQRRPKSCNVLIGNSFNDSGHLEAGCVDEAKDEATAKADCVDFDEENGIEDGEQGIFFLSTNSFPSLAQTMLVPLDIASDFLMLPQSLQMPLPPSDDLSTLDTSKTSLQAVDPSGDLMSTYDIFQAELKLGCNMELMGSDD